MHPEGLTDVVIVGGGIAGSALALVLARQGLGVTVLERQPEYRDRVRGEQMANWGFKEAVEMGIAGALEDAGGVFARRVITHDALIPPEIAAASAADISQVLPGVPGSYCAGHPASCRALSTAAEAAGARYVRGIGSVKVSPGARPTVTYELGERSYDVAARLVVGADGRTSTVRAQAGIPLHEQEIWHVISGLLVDGVATWPQDAFGLGAQGDTSFFIFPQGGQRVRLYTGTPLDQRQRYAGPAGVTQFLEDFRRLTCIPQAEALANATPIGPCATLGAEDTWTDVPFVEGVALIGDAAGYNNPIIGQGLSLALRDVHVLSDLLLSESSWSPGHLMPFAEERKERSRRLRCHARLFAEFFAAYGPEGPARRGRLFARLQDPNDAAQLLYAVPLAGPWLVPEWTFTEDYRAALLN
ncbi:MAG TPA: NAD(P)/FAD-dependent oxidoreductase [Chloroflexota bacterium]|nr:NAD(P)/FAD-dependent oxidoreductase [Chloroflexota bacterium]